MLPFAAAEKFAREGTHAWYTTTKAVALRKKASFESEPNGQVPGGVEVRCAVACDMGTEEEKKGKGRLRLMITEPKQYKGAAL